MGETPFGQYSIFYSLSGAYVFSLSLSQPFSLDEADRLVAGCDGNKSLGPVVLTLPSLRIFGI